jgi:2-oxoglutarate ferredoxin oxidoreductase subunit gamma
VSCQGVHRQILIAGFGGQGVVTAGLLLASAGLAEGREVAWAPSYGPEMRGGPVHCTVIVSSKRIGSPEVSLADSLLIMDRDSFDRFSRRVEPGGLLIVNSTLVATPEEGDGCTILPIPATEVAEELGEARAANVLMLGALLAERPVVSRDSLIEAMGQVASKAGVSHLLEVNLEALDRGMDLAREHRGVRA